MAERAGITPNRLPGTAPTAAQLLFLRPAHHARAPSHECTPWSSAHSHTDAVPAYRAGVGNRPALNGLIDDDRTEHVVGRADVAPGADNHLLSKVGRGGHAGWSADVASAPLAMWLYK